ncbi:hypothetical protein VNO80_33053 [Phaseolus coccineus]|uniref:Uncharacterized protein n=1 Tax=Phaseolus coccineus TaxID=3886 RepID=A0AAN9QCK1_PHACN
MNLHRGSEISLSCRLSLDSIDEFPRLGCPRSVTISDRSSFPAKRPILLLLEQRLKPRKRAKPFNQVGIARRRHAAGSFQTKKNELVGIDRSILFFIYGKASQDRSIGFVAWCRGKVGLHSHSSG